MRVDTVFLDFAKAFDKVDHSILRKKVIKHGIKGKIGKWILDKIHSTKRDRFGGCFCKKIL